MHHFRIVYKQSLKHMMKSPFYWIVTAIVLIISIFVLFIMPIIISKITGDDQILYYNFQWVTVVVPVLWILLPSYSAIIGESNAIGAENIYLLSKPLSKTQFLWSKLLASLTMSLFSFLVILIMFLVVFIEVLTYNKIHTKDGVEFFKYTIPSLFFVSMFLMVLFGSFIGTLLKYQTRGGLPTLISAGISIVFIVIVQMFFPFQNRLETIEANNILWVTSIVPEIIYPTIGLIMCIVLGFVFKKNVVES